MNLPLSAIERDLRRAAEAQRYDEVRRLVLSFCSAVEAHVRTLPAGDPRIPEIAQMTGEVLQWTRAMVQSGRESLAAQLRQLPKVKRYLPAPVSRPAVLQMDI